MHIKHVWNVSALGAPLLVGALTFIASDVLNGALPTNGLVGHWRMNESSGITVADSSGFNRNGTLVNGPIWTAGKTGNAVSLDGVNDYVTIGDVDVTPVSVCMWVKQPQTLNGWRSLVMKRSTYGFEVNNQNMQFGVGNGSVWSRTLKTSLALNQWEHFVGTYNGSAVTLYKNGVQIGTSQSATLANSNHPLLFGSWDGTQEFFKGQIDEVLIYNRALTSAEVQVIYADTSGSDTLPPTVSMTAPAEGATTSGSATIVSATASDNVGVAGVQFKLDGANLGAEDTSSPYSTSWNTLAASNGSHTLLAVARDLAGNLATSGPVNVTVFNDSVAPVISDVAATGISQSTATISWTTDEPATTQVEYGLTTSYGQMTSLVTNLVTSHSQNLSGLAASTTYHYQVRSGDNFGNVASSGDFTFTTEAVPPDTVAPSVLLTAPAEGATTSGSATIVSATASDNVGVAGVQFKLDGANLGAEDTSSPYSTSWNTIAASNGSHTLLAVARDAAGNLATSGPVNVTVFNDSTTPVISDVAASGTSENATTISWTTDEPATTQVEYGLTASYGQTTSLVTNLVTNHSQNLSGLAASTTYHYRVRSGDSFGNVATSGDFTFTTAVPPDTVAPSISLTTPTNGATVSGSATIVSATASDNVGVAGVQFKLDGANLGVEDTSSPYSTSWNTFAANNGSHTLVAVARDGAGNQTTSASIVVTVDNTAGFRNEILVTGLDFPTSMEFLSDGSIIVAELTGKIKRVLPGGTQPEPVPFLELTNVGNAGGLQGVMDIELDPSFATNGYLYVFYTLGTPNLDRLSRFTADGTFASVTSEVVIWQDTVASGTDHHGGAIVFGNDGKLYVSVGEHFVADNSQVLTNPRGKVLRFNSDGSVPIDNPFYDGGGPNYDAIWAIGLRNPFRMTIDRPTGRIFIADVGGNDYTTAREEINMLSRGANYGWPNCEGVCPPIDAGDPIFDYSHFEPNGGGTRDAAIVGGIVYRGSQFPPEYVGNYFYGDYTQNWIRRLTFDANGAVTSSQCFEPTDCALDGAYGAIVHMIVGPDGSLYYTDIGWENESVITGGKIRRIRYNSGNLPPTAFAAATPLSGPAPLEVTFSSADSADPEDEPVSYLWDFGDGTSSTLANPFHTYNVDGPYIVRLQVSDGVLASLSDPIFIRVGNPPHATVLTPTNGLFFRAGDVINFSGEATDAEDGTLPPSAFSWQVLFHHNTHIHPSIPLNGTTSGTYTIGRSGHDYSGNTGYEIVLTVIDSSGLEDRQSVFLYPAKVNLSFDSLPVSGLKLKLNGIDRVAPFVVDTLINFEHSIDAPDQILGGTSYTFTSWSDGGTQNHIITVPPANQNYAAHFTAATNLAVGLVAHWKFDEAIGATTAADSSGNNRHLTLVNGPTFVLGKIGNAINLDGSNDYGNGGDIDVSPGVSVSLWMKLSQASSTWASVAMKRFTYGFELNGQTLYFGIGNGSTWSRQSSLSVSLGQWQHIVGVYSGSTITLYNGGVQVGAPVSATLANSNLPLLVGSWDTRAEFFRGQIDDVRIYSRALNAAEVQQLFESSNQ